MRKERERTENSSLPPMVAICDILWLLASIDKGMGCFFLKKRKQTKKKDIKKQLSAVKYKWQEKYQNVYKLKKDKKKKKKTFDLILDIDL